MRSRSRAIMRACCVVEMLENRTLLAGDPNIGFALPYTLDFNKSAGGILDRDGQSTGFTYVQPNRLGNEYDPSKIDLRTGAGVLRLTSTGTASAGSNYEGDNTLVNNLETRFCASSKPFVVSTRIVGPLSQMNTANNQAGISFGPDQENFVELMVGTTSGGTGLQFIDEQKFKTGYRHALPATTYSIGQLASVNTLDLYLAGNPANGRVQAFYQINGGSLVQLPNTLTLSGAKGGAFFSNAGYAGILVQNKNNIGPVTATFDSFSLTRGSLGAPVAQGTGKVSIASRKIFNDVQGGAGQLIGTSIKNTGTGALTIPSGGLTITGPDAHLFSVTSTRSGDVTLAPGQSLSIKLTFSAGASTSLGVHTATLAIQSDDPNTPIRNVQLRGLATAGQGGTNEPSLQRILDLYQIPDNVGDSNPNDVYLDDPPVTPNDEVVMQTLKKAAAGPVTITPIATFGVSSSPAVEVGYYEAGTPSTAKELFYVNTADAQSVNVTPQGSTTFDPGSAAFGIESVWPGFTNTDGSIRTVYSEDDFNTFDTGDMRHIRFYPMKNADGSVVPNTFVFAEEETNVAKDNNDFVGIISNVTSAMAGPEIGTLNLNGAPSDTRMVFNKFQIPDPDHPDTTSEDVAKIRVRNTGTAALNVSSLSVSGAFSITAPSPTSFSVAPGKYQDITIQFTGGSTLGVKSGALTIHSNDVDEPSTVITLAGYYQREPEHMDEPTEAQIINNVFGYGTVITYPGQNIDTSGKAVAVGDEIMSGYWNQVDANLPVSVQEISAFHTQGNTATISWYKKGSSSLTTVFVSGQNDTERFFPRQQSDLSKAAAGSFKPGVAQSFGFKVDTEWSDDTKNVQEQPGGGYGHHMRFWPLRDGSGNYIPNTYLMSLDYQGVNYDYNDNTYIISNIRPSNLPSSVLGLAAYGSAAGTYVTWAASTDASVVGYDVYRSTKANSAFHLVNSAPLTTSQLVDSATAAGTTYYYRVEAVNGSGGVSEPSSTGPVIA